MTTTMDCGDPYGLFDYDKASQQLSLQETDIRRLAAINQVVLGAKTMQRRLAESDYYWALRVTFAEHMDGTSLRTQDTIKDSTQPLRRPASSWTPAFSRPQQQTGRSISSQNPLREIPPYASSLPRQYDDRSSMKVDNTRRVSEASSTTSSNVSNNSASAWQSLLEVPIIPARQIKEAKGEGSFAQPRHVLPIIINGMPLHPREGEDARKFAERLALTRLDYAVRQGVLDYFLVNPFAGNEICRAPTPGMENRGVAYYADWMRSHQEYAQALATPTEDEDDTSTEQTPKRRQYL